LFVTLGIILRGRAKSTKYLNWLRFPSRLDSARLSASCFCALTSKTAGRLLRLAREAKLSYRRLQYWLERYRTSRLAALARKPRIDRRRRRNLSAVSATWFIRIRLGISMAELISLTQ
jgi:hypothetical protein